MEVRVENTNEDAVKVVVTVEAPEIDRRIKSTYRDFAKRYRFPGFRAGKAPRPVIDNIIGSEAVAAAVAEEVINETYPAAIDQNNIYPLNSPHFDQDETPKDGTPFTYSFTVSVKPDLSLSSYEPPAVELPVQEATPVEVDAQIDNLVAHYSTYEDASAETPVSADSYADLAITVTDDDGNTLEDITNDSLFYGPEKGFFSDAFNQEIIGMKAGDKKEFTLAIPEDEESLWLSEYGEKNLHFVVECKAVKALKRPELTDEWVKETFHFDDVDTFRNEVRSSIEAQKASFIPRMKESAVVADLIGRVEGEPPQSMVDESETQLLQNFFTQLSRQGMTFDAYLDQVGLTSDTFKEDIKKQARDEALRQLALDAWAREKNLEVTDEDIKTEFLKAGAEDVEAALEQWRKNGQLYMLRQEILREKALNDVLDVTVVTEVDPSAEPTEEPNTEEQPNADTDSDQTAEETEA